MLMRSGVYLVEKIIFLSHSLVYIYTLQLVSVADWATCFAVHTAILSPKLSSFLGKTK